MVFPMAVVGTAGRGIIVYQLEGQPQEFKKNESPLKYQHPTVSIFLDKLNIPCGFALGSVEGRVAIQYVSPQNSKDNFTFKCHLSNDTSNGYQDIYAVNDIAFHLVNNTLAIVGSDGRFSFWDEDAWTKLKTSEQMDQSIVKSCFNARGEIFAYATSYDWSKHDAPIKTFHWIKAPNYSCIMTGSWDKTLKPNTMATEKGKKEEKRAREMKAFASVEMEVGSSTVTETVVEPETAAAQKCNDASILIESNVKQYNENERVRFSIAELQIKQQLFNSFSAIPSFGFLKPKEKKIKSKVNIINTFNVQIHIDNSLNDKQSIISQDLNNLHGKEIGDIYSRVLRSLDPMLAQYVSV